MTRIGEERLLMKQKFIWGRMKERNLKLQGDVINECI